LLDFALSSPHWDEHYNINIVKSDSDDFTVYCRTNISNYLKDQSKNGLSNVWQATAIQRKMLSYGRTSEFCKL
jgi:hypothetical protein